MPSLTKHALLRMKQRGITIGQVQAALVSARYRKGDRLICRSSVVTLVLTIDECYCITVWRND